MILMITLRIILHLRGLCRKSRGCLIGLRLAVSSETDYASISFISEPISFIQAWFVNSDFSA